MALTPEQKLLRLEAYGASEVATVVGKGPGKIEELWQSKAYPKPPAELDEESSLAAELGTLEEEPTARIYARRTKTFLTMVKTLRHPTKPLAIATPDRARFLVEPNFLRLGAPLYPGAEALPVVDHHEDLEQADRLVEVKTTGSRYRREYGEAGTGVVPAEKAIQCTWQLGVCGMDVADLPVLFRGEWGVKLETFTVTFNEQLFEGLYEAVEKFHRDYVVTKKPPPPTGTDAYDEVLAQVYPTSSKPAVVATPEHEQLMMRFAQLHEVERRVKLLRKTAQQELKTIIGEAAGMTSETLGKINWRRSKDGSKVDWAKACNDALQLGGLVLNGLQRLRADESCATQESIDELAARLKAIVPAATSHKPGHRTFRMYPKGDAALRLRQLSVALEALEADVAKAKTPDAEPLDVDDEELDVD